MTQSSDESTRGLGGLGGVERDLLIIIAGCGRSSGQTIKAHLQEYYADEINHGRLYSNLDRLVDKDIVSRGKIDGRTNSYTLTDAGRTAISEHWEWSREHFQW